MKKPEVSSADLSNHSPLTRRGFLGAAGSAAAGLLLSQTAGGQTSGSPGPRKKVALVGTGIRGTQFWGKHLRDNYGDVIEFVGLCDVNPGRLRFAREHIGADCPTFEDFDRMLAEVPMDLLIVTTVDSTHDEFIVKGLNGGIDVVTEKPMTTDEIKCQNIIDAARTSTGRLIMGFNYRYGGLFTRLKELMLEDRIGRITSIDFNWYLNTYHGASYFRRWHGLRDKGGTLLLHKSAHHFDLLNWWIASDPVEVHALGALEKYGANNPFRGDRCMDCPHSGSCTFHWDMTQDDFLMNLYHANEQHDGYIRDNCLWREEIDIFDKMAVQIKYANDVQVSYSLTTYSPFEGFRIGFNGMAGRIDTWEGIPSLNAIQVEQSGLHDREMDHTSHTQEELKYHEIVTQLNFEAHQREELPYIRSGHWGGDARMLDEIFRGRVVAPELRHASDVRDGSMAVLIGVAARKSIDEQRSVQIAELTDLKPRVDKWAT